MMADRIDADNLKQVQKELMTCTYCGFCKSVCPAFEGVGWEPSVARGRIILSYGLLNRDLPADESVKEYLYQCTTCKDCERRCPSKVRVVEVVERARRDLVASGNILPKHKTIVDNILATGNPYGERRSVRQALGAEDKGAEIGYFVGCTAAYRNPEIARATLTALEKLGVDFAVVDEGCCGSVMQRVGWGEDDVVALMERNVSSIVDRGVSEVVFTCSGCYRMFKEEYPQHVKVPFAVRHISEYLDQKELRLERCPGTITYHDPCHLGRHCGVYDPPRMILSRIPGAELREMPHNRELAHCCGGGGGVRSAYPELAAKIAARRVDEAAFADYLVTSCPFCVSNLKVGKQASTSKAEVVDLMQMIEPLM